MDPARPEYNAAAHADDLHLYTDLGTFASVSPYIIHVDAINYGRKHPQDRLILTNRHLPLNLHKHPMRTRYYKPTPPISANWNAFHRRWRRTLGHDKLDTTFTLGDQKPLYMTQNQPGGNPDFIPGSSRLQHRVQL
jgi:hypothetical protein